MNWTAEERETVVNASDADDLVRIWTAQRRYITKLRKDPRFTETLSGEGFAEFTIPAKEWSPLGAKRRRNLTDDQRNELRMRFQRAKEGRK